jgi:hypothetical protein
MGIFKYALFLCKVNFKIPVFVVRREKQFTVLKMEYL